MWYTYNTWDEGRYVAHYFQDEMSRIKVTRVVLTLSLASPLFDRITSYLTYIQHMRGQSVGHHFQDGRSRSHGSFKVLALSALWLRHFWPNHFIIRIYTTHEGTMGRALVFLIWPRCGNMTIWLVFGGWGVPHLLDPEIYLFLPQHSVEQSVNMSMNCNSITIRDTILKFILHNAYN